MSKTPEEYFLGREFGPGTGTTPEGEYTEAEKAFLQKYMGVEGKQAVEETGLTVTDEVLSDGADVAGAVQEPDLMEQLKGQEELQLVSFLVDGQEFTIPINVVQEVIRYEPPALLPMAPPFVAGVINLRGRVTPLVMLRKLLGTTPDGGSDDFIIICSRKGLQMGLVISKVRTMYRARQEKLDWNVESSLGAGAEMVAGLLQRNDRLVGVISVDRVVDAILKA